MYLGGAEQLRPDLAPGGDPARRQPAGAAPGRDARPGRQVHLAPRGAARRDRLGHDHRGRVSPRRGLSRDGRVPARHGRARRRRRDAPGDPRRRAAPSRRTCSTSATPARRSGCSSGILAGQPFHSVVTGDASIRRRPMDRVATPLRLMGARIGGRQGGRLAPLAIDGGGLTAIAYDTPVASAQVKSAVLLAGLFADGETTVREPSPEPGSYGADAGRLRRAGPPRRPRRPAARPRAAHRDGAARAGRPVVGRVLPGRRGARAGVRAHGRRRRPEPHAHRGARRARADGRACPCARAARGGRRARRHRHGPRVAPAGHGDRRDDDSAGDRRAAGDRGRRVPRRGRDRDPRRRGAARQGIRPHRLARARARSAWGEGRAAARRPRDRRRAAPARRPRVERRRSPDRHGDGGRGLCAPTARWRSTIRPASRRRFRSSKRPSTAWPAGDLRPAARPVRGGRRLRRRDGQGHGGVRVSADRDSRALGRVRAALRDPRRRAGHAHQQHDPGQPGRRRRDRVRGARSSRRSPRSRSGRSGARC